MTEAAFYVHLAGALGLDLKLPGGVVDRDVRALEEPALQERLLELIYPTPLVPWTEMRSSDRGVVYPQVSVTVAPPPAGSDARLDVAPPEMMAELAKVLGSGDATRALDAGVRSEFPFRLTNRRLRSFFNTSGQDIDMLRDREDGYSAAFMNPRDLAALGVDNGDTIVIASRYGEVEASARSSDDIRMGTVSMAHGCPDRFGRTTSSLVSTDVGFDPITGLPVQSAIPVKISQLS
jgi:anaerobic selenocysteine-containing dehydrogenase